MRLIGFCFFITLLLGCQKQEEEIIFFSNTYLGSMHETHSTEFYPSNPFLTLDTTYAHTMEIRRRNDSIQIWDNFSPYGSLGGALSRTYFYPISNIGNQIEFYDESLGGYIRMRLYGEDSLFYSYQRDTQTPSEVYYSYVYSYTGVKAN